MKKLFAVAAMAVIALLTGARGDPAYVGEWRFAPENSENIAELYRLFGSSLGDYGAGLNVSADGTLGYYLGLSGGEGEYIVSGDDIVASVRGYNQGELSIQSFRYIKRCGEDRIVYYYDNGVDQAEILWSRAE